MSEIPTTVHIFRRESGRLHASEIGPDEHVDQFPDDPTYLGAYVPRDRFELLREAAEALALTNARWPVFCGACGVPNDAHHLADCKAARILGLKREGAE